MSLADRVLYPDFLSRTMSADEAAALIPAGAHVGMSGFTGAGYPKAVPGALARRIESLNAQGHGFKIGLWTGARTAPELDGALAQVDGIEMRLPYQSDPTVRRQINAGQMQYVDIHLSHVAQFVWFGFLGKLDVAVVEVAGVLPDGRLIPSSSVGNNKTWLDQADKIILEVNAWHHPGLEGMHDIYYGTDVPPHRKPIPMTRPDERIGEPYLRCDPSKVIAVVMTNQPDRNSVYAAPDDTSNRIAGHIIELLQHEVKKGRLPKDLLPVQAGVGNIANAVRAGLNNGPFENLTAYTEVLQDGMLDMLRSGTLASASATALSLSPAAMQDFNERIDYYKQRIVLRPQEISNHPELIRRMGLIAMNGMIEADIYGNVNSTHIMGSAIMNGIGGSGDLARNAHLSIFMTPSLAKNGSISCIVPMASHVDHTEHDVQILVTEQGLADLRGHSPSQRAQIIIDRCAHPDFRPALHDYVARTNRGWWLFCLRVFLTMQRRQFTQSLVAASTGLLLATSSRAVGVQDPMDAKSVTIGCSLGTTGALASLGKELKQGLDAGIAQANAKGIHGREIKLLALDDGYDAARSEDNVRKLIADANVVSLISCMGTANNQRILPLVDEAQIPYVAPQSGATSLRKAEYRSVFHVRASYADEAQRLTQKLVSMGMNDLAIVYQDTAFGREFLADVNKAMAAAKQPAPKAFKLDAQGAQVPGVVGKAVAAKAAAVLLGTAGDVTATLVNEFKKVSSSTPLAATSVALSGDNLRQLGGKASGIALSMVLPDAARTSVAVVRDYQKAMRALGYQEFSARSFEGYVNARVLTEGLERAGRELTRAKLRSALAGIRSSDLGGLSIDYAGGAPYVGSRFLDLGVMGANGKFVG